MRPRHKPEHPATPNAPEPLHLRRPTLCRFLVVLGPLLTHLLSQHLPHLYHTRPTDLRIPMGCTLATLYLLRTPATPTVTTGVRLASYRRFKRKTSFPKKGGGLTGISQRLKKLDRAEADVKEAGRCAGVVEAERDAALKKAENAERALAAEADIGEEMNAANEELGWLSGELKKAHLLTRNLEDDLGGRNTNWPSSKPNSRTSLDQELATRLDELENLRKQIDKQSRKLKTNPDELRDTKGYVAELEAEAEVAAERVQAVETGLGSIRAHLRETVKEGIRAHERVELEEEVERLDELGYQMQGALEVADRRDEPHHGEVVQLRGTISALERELEKSRSPSRAAEPSMIPSADMDALENELDDADKEITRLKALMQQSLARRAIDAAKDNRIEMLEVFKSSEVPRMVPRARS